MKMPEWFQKLFKGAQAPEDAIADATNEVITPVAVSEDAVKPVGGLDKVVVGEVVFKDKHPNADRLSVTRVKIAEDNVLDIVCGAPNVEAGQKVAVALVGASLPNGMKIESREVRGVNSCGMICAEDELGLGSNHAGIMVLDTAAQIGTPIREALGL